MIFNEDCIDYDKKIPDNSVDLGIYDPPFGLGETEFQKHYKRNPSHVIGGYKEAPEDYEQWTHLWLSEAKRVLKPNGSMYVIMGHTNLRYLLNAAHNVGLNEINHIIWKYNFGVYTKKKFVTSHYHILYYSKSKKAKPTFNLNCRFGSQEKNNNGNSLLYQDMEDVFDIKKEYSPKQKKNQNKLPEKLINKLILYSSSENDMVCDFFMGNFTTAYCSLALGRRVCGYELNKQAYNYHIKKLEEVNFGIEIKNLRKVNNFVPANQGKKISSQECELIYNDYLTMLSQNMMKKDISKFLQEKYGRGKFSIKNIIDKIDKNSNKELIHEKHDEKY